MFATDLDATDCRILAALQDDCSRSIADIGEQAGLSQNACWRRIKRLEDDGVIRRRVALLDAASLGVPVVVFVTIRAAEHSEGWLEAFATLVRGIPEVVEFWRLAGEADYLLKLRVADIAAYDRVYKRIIGGVRLADVSSSFVMEEIKATTAVPMPSR